VVVEWRHRHLEIIYRWWWNGDTGILSNMEIPLRGNAPMGVLPISHITFAG